MEEYKVRVYENKTEWRNQDGKLHRLDGPAIEWLDGDKFWCFDGRLHRLDGPAIEWGDGGGNCREWYIEGIKYSEDEFNKKVREIKLA